MTTSSSSVFIFCGESSADHHGSRLAAGLRKRNSGLRMFGVGGNLLGDAGVELIRKNDDLAVVGFFEVLKHYGTFRKLFRQVVDFIRTQQVDTVILVDYPGFNLRLAKALRALPIKVYYYISPQLWAWAPKRIHEIAESIDHMLVIFDFEKELYEREKIPVSFVGHPLMDMFNPELATTPLEQSIKLSAKDKLIAFLPGSRKGEIARHLPPFLESIQILKERDASLQFVISASSPDREREIQKIQRRWCQENGGNPISVYAGDVNEVMKRAEVAIVASGTASLQTALYETPMVVVYKIHPLSYLIIRSKIQIDEIALVNVVAGRKVVPELVQDECNPTRIVQEVVRFLEDSDYHGNIKKELKQVRDKLGGAGASERAADVITELMHETIL